MAYSMFGASSAFFEEFSRVNDFAQVCAASVWSMRWQVKGFFAEAGFYSQPAVRPSESDLRARFLAGSGLHSANFRSLVDGQTWPEQSSILAEMLLLTVVSLFEGWSDAIGMEVGLSKINRDALQWPSHSRYPRYNRAGNPIPGVTEALQAGLSSSSAIMTTCFYPTFRTNRHYSLTHIDDLMVSYRYWKEIRNALAHAGGKATNRTIAEQSHLQSVTTASIGMSHVPHAHTMVLNEPIRLDLHSVNGFGEAIYNVVTTVDAEFTQSDKAEVLMVKRWETVRRSVFRDRQPPMSSRRRESYIRGLTATAGLPAPQSIADLDAYLTARYGVDLRVR